MCKQEDMWDVIVCSMQDTRFIVSRSTSDSQCEFTGLWQRCRDQFEVVSFATWKSYLERQIIRQGFALASSVSVRTIKFQVRLMTIQSGSQTLHSSSGYLRQKSRTPSSSLASVSHRNIPLHIITHFSLDIHTSIFHSSPNFAPSW